MQNVQMNSFKKTGFMVSEWTLELREAKSPCFSLKMEFPLWPRQHKRPLAPRLRGNWPFCSSLGWVLSQKAACVSSGLQGRLGFVEAQEWSQSFRQTGSEPPSSRESNPELQTH